MRVSVDVSSRFVGHAYFLNILGETALWESSSSSDKHDYQATRCDERREAEQFLKIRKLAVSKEINIKHLNHSNFHKENG